MIRIIRMLLLMPGDFAQVTAVLPGATDFLPYDVTASVVSDAAGGNLTLTSAKMGSGSLSITVGTMVASQDFGTNDQVVAPPKPSFQDTLTFTNTGTTNLTLFSVTLARRR